MREALIKLLKVKSLMTICVMGVFTYCAVTGQLQPESVTSVIMMVFAFYFAKKDHE